MPSGGRCEGSLGDLQSWCGGALRLHRFAGEQVRCPVEALVAQPGRGKVVVGRLSQDLRNGCLIGLGGRGGEGECDLPKSELEQAIAAARLAVIVALGCCAGDDLDLAIIETETPVDTEDLRFDGALVRKEEPRRAALDNRGALTCFVCGALTLDYPLGFWP
jgi:hypothetical protein